jgi:outer membrane receptor protein involved in Fe transport
VDNTVETKLPLSSNYKYKESVNAGYINYADKWKSFQYQVGLRMEFSKLDGQLMDSALSFGYKYPENLKNIWDAMFPSIFITKKITDNQDVQFNYSRRIRRPRFWEVNPFIDINDPLNIRQGNPALRPEYTHSLELNYFNQYKGGSFLGVLYFKNNIGDITSYSDTITTGVYNQLINAGVSPNAILNTFINAGYTNRMGAEFTVTKKFFDNLELTYNVDLQYRNTNAKVNDIDLSNSGFYWDTKLITNYKIVTPQKSLFNNLGFQLIANYEAPRIIPQGKTKEQFVADFAMRKEFLRNKKAAISFNINDIFNTRRWGTIYDTEDFYQDSYRRWDVRTFRLTFSYKFGNGDFDIFKKKNGNTADNEEG